VLALALEQYLRFLRIEQQQQSTPFDQQLLQSSCQVHRYVKQVAPCRDSANRLRELDLE
jgi:hypothetical protein